MEYAGELPLLTAMDILRASAVGMILPIHRPFRQERSWPIP